jgi:hypothetical protein
MQPKPRSPLRAVSEGAAFQLAFAALAFGALEAWARVCEARRTHR